MAIASPSPSSFSASFSYTRSERARLIRFPSTAGILSSLSRRPSRRMVFSRLNSSKSSGAGGSVFPDNGDLQYELQHGFPSQRRKGSPVFVSLPVDTANMVRDIRKQKMLFHSFKALSTAGVEGVVMEVWWGLVERDSPMNYNWKGYLELVSLAQRCGLKVRAVMAFHQYGTGTGDSPWIPLPEWVREEMDRDSDLSYCDRFGRRNREYLSLGCDMLPVLKGRSPIQTYSDFMRSFRDTFREFLGVIITGIQVGMGPAGELRYPSYPSKKLALALRFDELGEFQCYDKYMLASLNACARDIGRHEWGNEGTVDVGNVIQDPEVTKFFRSYGSWNTLYGRFFLEWYSGMLLLHGERLCMATETIFSGTGATVSAKVAGMHWHYFSESHPSKLTAGYYNTSSRDGYLAIARMFGRYGFTLFCKCFELEDPEEKQVIPELEDRKENQMNPNSSPEGFLSLLLAARTCDITLEGENSAEILDDESLQQVLKMSKFYSDGLDKPSYSFSFNFVRMNKNLFEYRNWVRFTRFVKQMSDIGTFQAKLDMRMVDTCHSSSSMTMGVGAFAYC